MTKLHNYDSFNKMYNLKQSNLHSLFNINFKLGNQIKVGLKHMVKIISKNKIKEKCSCDIVECDRS